MAWRLSAVVRRSPWVAFAPAAWRRASRRVPRRRSTTIVAIPAARAARTRTADAVESPFCEPLAPIHVTWCIIFVP